MLGLYRRGRSVWRLFTAVFRSVPLCALIDRKIVCMHGGIWKSSASFDTIKSLRLPVNIPDQGYLCDLVWADPSDEISGWDVNEDRGVSCIFGQKALRKFRRRFDIDMVIRAHEEVERGFRYFGDEKRLITVFSSHNYCDGSNSAGVVRVGINSKIETEEYRPRTIDDWLLTKLTEARREASDARKRSSANVVCVLGAQWGYEGKGKIVDTLVSKSVGIVARCQGGTNAGQTVVADGKMYDFHILPSAIHENSVALIV